MRCTALSSSPTASQDAGLGVGRSRAKARVRRPVLANHRAAIDVLAANPLLLDLLFFLPTVAPVQVRPSPPPSPSPVSRLRSGGRDRRAPQMNVDLCACARAMDSSRVVGVHTEALHCKA
jgi:hypothetical protein